MAGAAGLPAFTASNHWRTPRGQSQRKKWSSPFPQGRCSILRRSTRFSRKKGYKAFRDHQVRYQNTPLRPGVAFPFVRRLLALNELYGDLAPFRVIALSRNSPETAQRFFHSCRHYRLPISAGGFTSGH